MGRTGVRRYLVWLLVAALLTGLALGLLRTRRGISPGDIIANPADFDGKRVTVDGTVSDLREKVSRRGNPYYTFKLTDDGDRVPVFAFGTPAFGNGDRVRVTGVYSVEKRVGQYTFFNEIDASKGRIQRR